MKHAAPETPAAEWVPTGDIHPWEKNPRKNDRAVAKVAASIERFGFGAPIVARLADRKIIAGHTRYKAAVKLGLDRVPVRFLDVDEASATALAIADNKIGEIAKWDDDLLAEVLQSIADDGAQHLSATGFAEHELRRLLDHVGDSAEDDAILESEPDKIQRRWETAPGQLWKIPSRTVAGGVHHLICGSSTDQATVARVCGDDRACTMWTDPPYGVAYVGKTGDALQIDNDRLDGDALRKFLDTAFRLADERALAPGASIYIAHPPGEIAIEFLLAVRAVQWKVRQGLVWVKDVLVLGRSDYHYRHEPIIYAAKPGAKGRHGRGGTGWFGGNAETSVFEIDRPKVSSLHPTMKPEKLVERMVQNSTPPGGIVYEPFSGSGTTLLACEASGRLCRAVELDPRFVAVALERLNEAGCRGQLSAS